MRAFHLLGQAGPDSLSLVELPSPTPDSGQVVVRVHATSLNYRDLMVADGRYGRANLPLIPLSDGAGEIIAVGAGVKQWKKGDRVAGTFFQGWEAGAFRASVPNSALGGALDGVLAEQVVLSEDGVVSIPEHLSFEQAATLPCAALTAWQSLVERGRISAGQTVLLLGTGGVSLFALQFAKMHGARVIITSSSDEKLERARAMGADATINYQSHPDWDQEVFRITHKSGVDHVVEVGGKGTLAKSLRSLAPGGCVHVIGGVSGFSSELALIDLIGRSANLHGIYVGNRQMFVEMNRAITASKLEPVIDRVFPFEQAPDAYHYQASGAHFGKVVITLEKQ